jgi:hypothetical protein
MGISEGGGFQNSKGQFIPRSVRKTRAKEIGAETKNEVQGSVGRRVVKLWKFWRAAI